MEIVTDHSESDLDCQSVFVSPLSDCTACSSLGFTYVNYGGDRTRNLMTMLNPGYSSRSVQALKRKAC